MPNGVLLCLTFACTCTLVPTMLLPFIMQNFSGNRTCSEISEVAALKTELHVLKDLMLRQVSNTIFSSMPVA